MPIEKKYIESIIINKIKFIEPKIADKTNPNSFDSKMNQSPHK